MTESKSVSQGEPLSQAESLDLSKYRTPELVEVLVALISIPQAVIKVFLIAVCVTILIVVLTVASFWYSGIGIPGWLLLLAYSSLAGLGLGLLTGIILVIQRAMAHVEGLLNLVFNIAKLASRDYGDLRTGKKRRPTGGELIQQIFREIFLPSLEEAVAKTFGIIGKPVLWVYRRTLSKAFQYVIAKINRTPDPEETKTGEDEAVVANSAASASETDVASTDGERSSETGAEYCGRIERYATRAQSLVHSVGKKLRWMALIPMYLMLAMLFLVVSLPLILLRIFAV